MPAKGYPILKISSTSTKRLSPSQEEGRGVSRRIVTLPSTFPSEAPWKAGKQSEYEGLIVLCKEGRETRGGQEDV